MKYVVDAWLAAWLAACSLQSAVILSIWFIFRNSQFICLFRLGPEVDYLQAVAKLRYITERSTEYVPGLWTCTDYM